MAGVNPDQFRLGPISQTVKRRAKPAQWKKIVKDAHAKGFTVESYLDQSVPNEYKARTKESLKKQATTTLAGAYAPAEKLLGEREGRINALSAKRKLDNEFYMDWLTKTRSSMQASASASDQALRASAQKIHDDAVAAHQAGIQQAADQLMQQPGNVTNRDELVKSLEISPENVRRLELINNQRTAIEGDAANAGRHRAAQDANVIAQQAAVQAAQASETWKSLTEVADDKLKLQMEKGAGVAEEISRLLNQEIEKAGANRDFDAVSEKLGLQGRELSLKTLVEEDKAQDRDTDNELNALKLEETKRRNKTLEDIANLQLDQSAERIRVSWYTARKNAYNKKNGGKGVKYEDTAEGRYNTYYAKLAESRIPTKDGQSDRALSPDDVKKNPVSWERKLVAEGLTQAMARKIVQAFINGRVVKHKDGKKTVRAGAAPAFKVTDPKPRG